MFIMLKLVKLEAKYRPLLEDMMAEWLAAGEEIVPWAIAKHDYRDFDAYLLGLDIKEPTPPGLVPDSTFFALDTERERFIGAVNIRHRLNDRLLRAGGHIGDGVRPSERRKGYGTAVVGLALEKCRELGIMRVLMVCDKDNIASAKTIQKNGGVLENEIEDRGELVQRYWINLGREAAGCE